MEFGAPDGRPTHIFLALVAPADAAAEHLTILARGSSLLRRPELRERLMAAGTAEEMRRILVAEDGERWG